MEISHQFGFCLQLVNIVDSFLGWWACREKLAWWALDDNCVSVVVSDDGDEWNAVETIVLAPTAQDSSSRYGDDHVILIVDVDLVAGKDCCIAGIRET